MLPVRSNNGNDCGRNHIGPHHSFKTHSGGEHGNDFRVFCQLGSKEDNSDKDKQGAEQIGEVGDEVHVIIKYNRFQRSFVIDEPVYIFVHIKYYCNGDNQCNSEK